MARNIPQKTVVTTHPYPPVAADTPNLGERLARVEAEQKHMATCESVTRLHAVVLGMKADLLERMATSKEMEQVTTRLDQVTTRLDQTPTREETPTRKEVEQMGARLEATIEARIASSEARMLRWMIGIGVTLLCTMLSGFGVLLSLLL